MKNFADKEKQQKTQEDKLEHQRKSSSELEEDSEEEISPPEFQLNEHIDCCDSVNKWLDAEIIAVIKKHGFLIIKRKNIKLLFRSEIMKSEYISPVGQANMMNGFKKIVIEF